MVADSLTTREGSYGILLWDSDVLVCWSRYCDRLICNFPGGGIDAGETPEEALIREFQEETGIVPQIGRHLFTSDELVFINPDFSGDRLLYHYFFVTADVSQIVLEGNADDVDRLEWMSVRSLPRDEMLEVDKYFCCQLYSLLTAAPPV